MSKRRGKEGSYVLHFRSCMLLIDSIDDSFGETPQIERLSQLVQEF